MVEITLGLPFGVVRDVVTEVLMVIVDALLFSWIVDIVIGVVVLVFGVEPWFIESSNNTRTSYSCYNAIYTLIIFLYYISISHFECFKNIMCMYNYVPGHNPHAFGHCSFVKLLRHISFLTSLHQSILSKQTFGPKMILIEKNLL